jgi:hypothetical protein
MRVGPFGKRTIASSVALALLTTVALPQPKAAAQMPPSSGSRAFGGGSMGPTDGSAGGRPVQAVFLAPLRESLFGGQSPYVDAHGNPIVVPVSHCQACEGGYAGGMPMGYGGACPPGCDEFPADFAGYGMDQRGPHYFDVRAEFVYMRPDETFTRDIDFTVEDVGGPVVLSSDQLDYDWEPGFRIMGRYDICPLSVVEFGYWGIYDWRTEASFRDPDEGDPGFEPDLFSLFSDFGNVPNNVPTAGGPMPETERSLMHTISLDLDLHTAEISYRRYWVGFIPRISGTLLAGFRYTRLKETFQFSTIGEAALDYTTKAENDLAGFQTGGDVWVALFQGVRIGAEGKVGIYNNNFDINTDIVTTPEAGSPPDLSEHFGSNNAAFISEASVDVVADILPSWSLRAGYEVLFINSIALASENFNTGSPFGLPNQEERIPFFFDQGDMFLHGFHAGVEYVW